MTIDNTSTLINQTQRGYNQCCEPETILVLTLSSVFGFLLLLLHTIIVWLVLYYIRRRKRRRSIRFAGSVRRLEPHPIRRISLPLLLELHSNLSYGVSPHLGRREGNRSRASTASSRLSSESSNFNISPNPSYTLVTRPEATSDTPAQGDTSPVYDDILNFPSRQEKGEGEAEIYDRLQPISFPPDSQDYVNMSEAGILKQTLSPYENTTVGGEPCKPKPYHGSNNNSTPLPHGSIVNSLLKVGTGNGQYSGRSQMRLSDISDSYVNEFDGPPSAYKPKLPNRSPSTENDQSKSTSIQTDILLRSKREGPLLKPRLRTSASLTSIFVPLQHLTSTHHQQPIRSSSLKPSSSPCPRYLQPNSSACLKRGLYLPILASDQWMKVMPVSMPSTPQEYEVPVTTKTMKK